MMSAPAGKSLPVVLVVEDEPLLRILAVEVVEEAGFTDINMPGSMDGLKLAHAVHNRWPPDQDPGGVG